MSKILGKIIVIQNYGIAKQINCTFCKSIVREVYDNVYACEWKFDGSGVKLPSDARIEIIDLEESEEIEETDVSNFKERLSLAFKSYKSRQKLDEELFRAYLDKHKFKKK